MGKMISRAVGITVTSNMAGHPKWNWQSMARLYNIAIYKKKQWKSNQAENSYLNSPKSKKMELAIETKPSWKGKHVRSTPIPTKNTLNIQQKSRIAFQAGSIFHRQPFQRTNKARKTRETDYNPSNQHPPPRNSKLKSQSCQHYVNWRDKEMPSHLMITAQLLVGSIEREGQRGKPGEERQSERPMQNELMSRWQPQAKEK